MKIKDSPQVTSCWLFFKQDKNTALYNCGCRRVGHIGGICGICGGNIILCFDLYLFPCYVPFDLVYDPMK